MTSGNIRYCSSASLARPGTGGTTNSVSVMSNEKAINDISNTGDHSASGIGSESVSSTETVRFEIKKWNAVTMWSWDICADTCAICRNSLNEPSIEYQVIYDFVLSCY